MSSRDDDFLSQALNFSAPNGRDTRLYQGYSHWNQRSKRKCQIRSPLRQALHSFSLSLYPTPALPRLAMSDLLQERLSAASKFLLQSPPGEINDVFTDLRSLVSDAQQLERSILPALKQYNLEQYIVATLPGQSGGGTGGEKVIVTPDSRLSTTRTTSEEEGSVEERHVDYRRGMSFAFDHMNSVSFPLSLPLSLPLSRGLTSLPLFTGSDGFGSSTNPFFLPIRPRNPLNFLLNRSLVPKTRRKPLQRRSLFHLPFIR